LITALIWGLAFAAQRIGMAFMGPFTFNGLRFTLGSFSLLPVLWWWQKTGRGGKPAGARESIAAGVLAGLVLFLGASFQQVGLMTTTAGKAGFITGPLCDSGPNIRAILGAAHGTFHLERSYCGSNGFVFAKCARWFLYDVG